MKFVDFSNQLVVLDYAIQYTEVTGAKFLYRLNVMIATERKELESIVRLLPRIFVWQTTRPSKSQLSLVTIFNLQCSDFGGSRFFNSLDKRYEKKGKKRWIGQLEYYQNIRFQFTILNDLHQCFQLHSNDTSTKEDSFLKYSYFYSMCDAIPKDNLQRYLTLTAKSSYRYIRTMQHRWQDMLRWSSNSSFQPPLPLTISLPSWLPPLPTPHQNTVELMIPPPTKKKKRVATEL